MDESTADISDDEVDSLLQEAEGTPGPTQRVETKSVPTPEAPVKEPEDKIIWNGKEVNLPLSKIKMYAQQAYDYNQKMHAFNEQKKTFELTQAEVNKLKETYSPVDEYIKQNPDWWNHVQQSWEQRQQFQKNAVDPIAQELSAVKTQLSELSKFRSEYETEKRTAAEKAADQALAGEVESFQKQYPDINLMEIDDTGKTLEYRILEHAQQNGISSFRAAARDYQADKLEKLWFEKGKDSVGSALKKQSKLGVLGTTTKSTKQVAPTQNIKSKSYDQLAAEAIAELGA